MRTLVVAPHPDDELLVCGGLLMQRNSEGAQVGIVIRTSLDLNICVNIGEAHRRQLKILGVSQALSISKDDAY